MIGQAERLVELQNLALNKREKSDLKDLCFFVR